MSFFKETKVTYKGKKALLSGYFDAPCLLFDKKDGKPDMGDVRVLDDYYPEKYFVFLTDLSPEERQKILNEQGRPVFAGCVCATFCDDQPKDLARMGYVEIAGEDPLEYDAPCDFVDPSKYVIVKCKACGQKYKVNKNNGYRVAYYKWIKAV